MSSEIQNSINLEFLGCQHWNEQLRFLGSRKSEEFASHRFGIVVLKIGKDIPLLLIFNKKGIWGIWSKRPSTWCC
jgi:hypothetical protein